MKDKNTITELIMFFEVDNIHINEIVEKIINILNLKKPK